MHHTKGRRRDLVERAKKKGIYIITFDGGLMSSFGNVHGPNHHWRVSLYSPMNDGNFLSDNSPSDRWEMMKSLWNVKYEPWRKSNPEDPILFVLQPKATTFKKMPLQLWNYKQCQRRHFITIPKECRSRDDASPLPTSQMFATKSRSV